MEFDLRKLLPQNNFNTTKTSCYLCCSPFKKNISLCSPSCFSSCPKNCEHCFFQVFDLPLPPPLQPRPPLLPPPVPSRHGDGGGGSNAKELVTVAMIIMSCVIVGMLLFGILCAVIRVFYLRRNSSRRTNPPIIFGAQEDFFDEDHGPVLDHPIWYINTIGLSQSVIDSIAVFKYKKDEGLIEGMDCSVCLSEFQEDENLRLLPKCSHAFHITCIDTWLMSHKNCPLCRAPIIPNAVVAQASESEPTPNGLDSGNGSIVLNLENYRGEGSSSVRGGVNEIRYDNSSVELPVEDDHSADDPMKILGHLEIRNCYSGCRVLSDLAGNRRVVEEDTQPMRRSVSLDSSAASMVYNAVANGVMHDKPQGQNNDHLGQSKSSKSKIASKSRSGSSSSRSSVCKLIKSSSIGSSLQKGHMSMKRSFSSSGRFSISSSRHCRCHSVLPL